MQRSSQIYPIERVVSCLSYLTVGMAGFVWLLIAAIFKKQIRGFLMYHIMLSIFLSIGYFLITAFAELIYVILYRIPIINAFPYLINMPIPFLFNLSIIQTFTTTVVLYLAITSAMGFYSYIPWFSNIINQNVGRK